MEMVNVYDAKTQLSRLLARVENGEEVIIARRGRPVARLVPEPSRQRRRVLGWDADNLDIDYEAVDEALGEPLEEDDLADWYGR